ncbi:unnamed protein product [Owenia fusiformis]|uniref:Uncharacterized protein n=1 Tax=Owenia fusiformis TaxID=6347 RepID=A0A8J1USB6_OWEFU|nr:unnamed protein product [Owenia fusiformis]
MANTQEQVSLIDIIKEKKDDAIPYLKDLLDGDTSNKPSVNAVDSGNRTAIYWAANLNLIDVVEFLLSHNCDVNISNNNLQTPLHIACQPRLNQIAAVLIKSGRCNINSKDAYTNTPMHLAARREMQDIVQLLCDYNATPDVVTGDGSTAMHEAAESGNPEIVEILLNAGFNPDPINSLYVTPFMLAARQCGFNEDNDENLDQVLKLLIRRGCSLSGKLGLCHIGELISKKKYKLLQLFIKYGLCLKASVQESIQSNQNLMKILASVDPETLEALVHSGIQISVSALPGLCDPNRGPLRGRYVSFHFNTEEAVATMTGVKTKCASPLELKCLTRARVRERLSGYNGGKSLIEIIKELPLPKPDLRYLHMDDCLYYD